MNLAPFTVARALLLNAPLGIVFGWWAWRQGLEVAMVSHVLADALIITAQHLRAYTVRARRSLMQADAGRAAGRRDADERHPARGDGYR